MIGWLRVRLSAPMRLALITLGFTLLISMPVLLFVYHQTDSLFEQGVRDRIDSRQRNLLQAYGLGGAPALIAEIDEELGTGTARGGAMLLVDSSNRKIAGNIAAWPPTLRAGVDWAEIRLYPEGSRLAVLYVLRTIQLPTGERLLLGSNVEDREHMRASLLEALVGALLLAIPLGLIGGMGLVRVTERQARAIGKVASQIAAGDFSHRLDERAEAQEFAMVAAAINSMLERIEELVEQLRLVTEALAHDLRSPLTRMRANLEKVSNGIAGEAQQRALDAVSSDIDRLLRLISATLEISRAEAGMGRQQFEEFDLGDLIRAICEIYQPMVEEKGLTMDVVGARSVRFFGNRQMIGRAVANLIDNALKYGADGGAITLGLAEKGETVEILVGDRGPGIPSALRADAVRKYRRLEEARTTEGSGLGLAMARAVARLHGGEIFLEENEPGLRVRMVLRCSKPSAAEAGH